MNDTSFASSDLSLCAALIMNGHQPVEHIIVDGKRHIFKFVSSTDLLATVDVYNDGSLTGSLLAHSNGVRELATMIRSESNRGHKAAVR